MDINFDFEQDFVKQGKGAKHSGTTFIVKGSDFKSKQLDRLKLELQKYDISDTKRYKIASEMEAMNSIEYMNMKYLAAVIMIFEDYKGDYQDEDEVNTYLYDLFKDKQKISFFVNKVMDNEKEKDKSYIKLIKSILLSYSYKLFKNRKSGYEF
jgi:hypothetical protein